MTDRDILMMEGGTVVGLLVGMFLAWAITVPLNHQRDFWRDAYCAAEANPPAFCSQETNQ